MNIVIAGGTGFIGEALVRRLVERGDDVAVLSRNPAKVTTGRGVQWDGRGGGAWTAEVDRADAVINLAGENIGGGRWTDQRKRELIASRIDATTSVVGALGKAIPRKRVLIHASAVGYYGFDGDAEADENAPRGTGFLADLVVKWEAAAR
jgi:NAD dependent epimerase/dehydratase family enzyme